MKKILFLFVLLPLMGWSQGDAVEAARKKIESGKFAEAKSDLTKIIATSSRNKTAFLLRGRAHMGLNDFYGAIGDFNFALEIDSTYAEALNYRGESKINLGDDEAAILDCEKFRASRLCPRWVRTRVHHNLARAV
ncbi:MAG TPA: hypothetical protein PLJ08_13725, partial [Cyclobacteriaceae bacterium]|nr:hypothetical protein [Cyclobacteriaceae bacterium]